MQLVRFRKFPRYYNTIGFIPIIIIIIIIIIVAGVFLKNSYGFSVESSASVVVPKKKAEFIQAIGIRKGIKLALQKAVILLIGKANADKKKNNKVLNEEIYLNGRKFVYSFKIIKAERYLNLFYIKLVCNIHKKELENSLTGLGFKIIRLNLKKPSEYSIYKVKFVGSFRYADINKLEKKMMKYSGRLKSIYISSFSTDFVEVKVGYRGSFLRFLKSVRKKIDTYLDAKVYAKKHDVVYIDVKQPASDNLTK